MEWTGKHTKSMILSQKAMEWAGKHRKSMGKGSALEKGKIDWSCGGSLDIEINFAPKKSTTPLVQRLTRQRRSIEKKVNGQHNFNSVGIQFFVVNSFANQLISNWLS